MRNFEGLNIWKDAKYLCLEVYSIFKDNRDFGFKDQIQRASVSVMNNIAEGSEAGSDFLFVRYLNIAKGSCAEVRSMLYLCKDLNYCSEEGFNELIEKTYSISKGICKLISYLETSNKK